MVGTGVDIGLDRRVGRGNAGIHRAFQPVGRRCVEHARQIDPAGRAPAVTGTIPRGAPARARGPVGLEGRIGPVAGREQKAGRQQESRHDNPQWGGSLLGNT